MYKKKESWLSCYTHSAAYATSIKPYTFHTNKEIVLFCAWWRLLLMLLLLFMPQNALREHFFDISDLEIGEEEAEQQQQQYIYLWKITSNRLWSLTAHNCMLYILQGKPGTHIHHKMWLHWLLFEVFFFVLSCDTSQRTPFHSPSRFPCRTHIEIFFLYL